MPWNSLENVPAQVRTHKGKPLTLAQANHWARIFDNLKNNPQLRNPAGASWAAWENVYKIQGDDWVKKQTDSKENEEPDEVDLKTLSEGVQAVFCNVEGTAKAQTVLFDKDKYSKSEAIEWLKAHNFKSVTSRETETQIRFRQIPPGDCSGGFGTKEETWMESVVMVMENHSVKVVGESPDGNPLIHGVAVTTNVSNKHRFPIDVLDAGINTLIGQPLVEGHSGWPNDDVKTSDTFGMIVDAWVNREAKHAEFIAEVWDDKYKKVVDKMPHRAKYSVGFRHNYEMNKDIKVSTGVFFDHLGSTNRPADPDSILLGIKEDAEARGYKVSMEGKSISVVNLSGDNKAKGGTGMTPDEKKLEEKRVADCKALLEKATITDEDKKTLEESITKTVPTVEEFTDSVKEAEDKKKEAEDIAAKKATDEKSPKTKPPAPETEKKTETEEAGKDALVGEVKALKTSLEAEEKKRQELETIVTKMQAEAKQKEVEGYVDSLVDAGIKQPAQRDDLVGLYMTFNDAQMQKEIEINKVPADLSKFFDEKAQLKPDEKEELFEEPDRKTIT